jgi:hypothetical protein
VRNNQKDAQTCHQTPKKYARTLPTKYARTCHKCLGMNLQTSSPTHALRFQFHHKAPHTRNNMWRIRRSTAPSPTTTLVNDLSSAASVADLPSVVDWLPSSEQLGLGHESEWSFKLFPHKTVTSSFSDCQDVGVGSSLPPRGPPGFDNCWFRLSSSNVLVQVGVSAVLPLTQAHHLPSMPVFCQEVHSPVKPATTVSAASSSQGASRSSTSVAAPVSSKLKPGKRKTIMCNNLQNCRFGKGCTFAHSESELRYFTLEELRQEQKRPDDFLTRPCLDYVTCGYW